jgi:hypothetical protein
MKTEKNKTLRNIILIALVTVSLVGLVYLSKAVPIPTQKVTKVIENSKFSK